MMAAYQVFQRPKVRQAFLQAGRLIVDKGTPLPFEDCADPLLKHGGPPFLSLTGSLTNATCKQIHKSVDLHCINAART
jgi:hypothetical protein